jgi:hypothetical protein
MADLKLAYGTASDVTITLASLASDTNLLTGRESTAVDNTSSLVLDYLVSGKITAGTAPTNTGSKSIEVWAVGSWDGTNWPSVFDGTDSDETVTSADIKASVCRFVAAMACDTTADRSYFFGPVSLAAVFGGTLPPKFVFFVTHNLRTSATPAVGVALNSTAGNHKITIQPVFQTVN